jgi:predicted amidohydrolase YtcJ
MGCCSNGIWEYLGNAGELDDVVNYLPPREVREARAAQPASGSPPDVIFHNGKILLATPTVSTEAVTAVAVTGSTISDVGDATRILATAGPDTTVINLRHDTLAPGFIEAHAHIISAVEAVYSIDLRTPNANGIEAVYAAINEGVAKAANSGQKWVFFINFDPSLLPFAGEQGFPQLDFHIFSTKIDNPNRIHIFVENASGHIAYANREAFFRAGITTSTDPGDGGWYGTENGELNGVMFEPSSFKPFLKFVRPGEIKHHYYHAMLNFLRQCQNVGITTVHDPAVGISGALAVNLEIYAALANDPKAATAVVGSVVLTTLYAPASQAQPSANGAAAIHIVDKPSEPGGTGSFTTVSGKETISLTIPNLKIWADGSTQGYTGYLKQPYDRLPITPPGLADPTQPWMGKADWSDADLQSLMQQAQENNWSLLVHCNGDHALQLAIDAIQNTYGDASKAYRNRIEHCTVTESGQYKDMAALGITPSYLTNHILIWGETFHDNILGAERAERLDAAKDALDNGMIFSFHCDYATSLPGPLQYMQTAVTRRTAPSAKHPNGMVLGAEYRISQMEALKAVTIYPAKQLGIDGSVGWIAYGNDADFVRLGDDPVTCAADAIAQIPIVETWLKGRRIKVTAPTDTLATPV